MTPHCDARHPVTRYRCTLPAGHHGDHAARCRLRSCGGHGRTHAWGRVSL
jgi:hypothetical protein